MNRRHRIPPKHAGGLHRTVSCSGDGHTSESSWATNELNVLIKHNIWDCSLSCWVRPAVGRRRHVAVCPQDAGGDVSTHISGICCPIFPIAVSKGTAKRCFFLSQVNSARSHWNIRAGEHGGAHESSPPDQTAPLSWFLCTRPFCRRYMWFSALFSPPHPQISPQVATRAGIVLGFASCKGHRHVSLQTLSAA